MLHCPRYSLTKVDFYKGYDSQLSSLYLTEVIFARVMILIKSEGVEFDANYSFENS